LPASDGKASKEKLEKSQKKATPVIGKGRILVMDDEKMIRHLAGEILSYLGYKVSFSKDGTKAIEMYKDAMESGEPFDAVVLDLTVRGGMGGKEAIRKLMEIDPHVTGVVSSGYSDDSVMTDFEKYGFKGVVAKQAPSPRCQVAPQLNSTHLMCHFDAHFTSLSTSRKLSVPAFPSSSYITISVDVMATPHCSIMRRTG
jgi:CheY-like chemotaxis protein